MQRERKFQTLDSAETFNVKVDRVDRCGFQLGAGLTGTVSFEASVDGTNFVALGVTPAAGSAVVTSTAAAGAWTADVAAYESVQMRVSTYGSGSAVACIAPAVTAK